MWQFVGGLLIGTFAGFLLLGLLAGSRMAEMDATISGLREYIRYLLQEDKSHV